jgi:hypothetical protein
MRKIALLMSAISLSSLFLTSPTHAAVEPSIALIDVGFNTEIFKNNIIYEVCNVEYTVCSNKKTFMEGPGSASFGPSKNSAASHGTQMLSIILNINPKAKVIPMRITGLTDAGNPYIYSLDAVKSSLDWIITNREKYNISVVSLAQGKIFAGCKMPTGMAEDLAILKAKNVQVVVATGNDSNRTTMMAPACSPDVISVGATDNPDPGSKGLAWDKKAKPYIARYSNGNSSTSVYANARWYVTNLDGTTKFMVGTSNAEASVASWILLNKGADWNATYKNLLSAATGTASNEWLTGKFIFIDS